MQTSCVHMQWHTRLQATSQISEISCELYAIVRPVMSNVGMFTKEHYLPAHPSYMISVCTYVHPHFNVCEHRLADFRDFFSDCRHLQGELQRGSVFFPERVRKIFQKFP